MRRVWIWLKAMLCEGTCDHCGGTLIPEMNRGTLARSTVVICGHCDRPHARSGCAKCDVMLAAWSTETSDIDETP